MVKLLLSFIIITFLNHGFSGGFTNCGQITSEYYHNNILNHGFSGVLIRIWVKTMFNFISLQKRNFFLKECPPPFRYNAILTVSIGRLEKMLQRTGEPVSLGISV